MPSAMARKANVRKVKDYERRRPERTLLYQLIEEYYPRFLELLATQGRSLPEYVQSEFEDFLKCGRLEHGFLRAEHFGVDLVRAHVDGLWHARRIVRQSPLSLNRERSFCHCFTSTNLHSF